MEIWLNVAFQAKVAAVSIPAIVPVQRGGQPTISNVQFPPSFVAKLLPVQYTICPLSGGATWADNWICRAQQEPGSARQCRVWHRLLVLWAVSGRHWEEGQPRPRVGVGVCGEMGEPFCTERKRPDTMLSHYADAEERRRTVLVVVLTNAVDFTVPRRRAGIGIPQRQAPRRIGQTTWPFIRLGPLRASQKPRRFRLSPLPAGIS
jgi:hypothetical protein